MPRTQDLIGGDDGDGGEKEGEGSRRSRSCVPRSKKIGGKRRRGRRRRLPPPFEKKFPKKVCLGRRRRKGLEEKSLIGR